MTSGLKVSAALLLLGKLNFFRVNYVDVFGLDVTTGAEIRERIAPRRGSRSGKDCQGCATELLVRIRL